jgi:hypothetical protein
MIRYLYIDESGDVGISTQPPTGIDLDAIDNGILQVIVITGEDVKEIGGDLVHVDLQPAVLANDEGGSYHYIPSK